MYNNKIALNDKYKTLNCDCSDWRKKLKSTQNSEKNTKLDKLIFIKAAEIEHHLRLKKVKDTIIK